MSLSGTGARLFQPALRTGELQQAIVFHFCLMTPWAAHARAQPCAWLDPAY